MKVYHIKTIIPKVVSESEEFNRIIDLNVELLFRVYGGLSIERGVYFTNHSTFVGDIEHEDIFLFCDDLFLSKITKLFEYVVDRFGGVSYEMKEITLDVKLERYKDELFYKMFYEKGCDSTDDYNLQIYLEDYVTYDDVLIKVSEEGIDSLNEFERNVLDEASKTL